MSPHVAIVVQNLPVPFDRRVWAEARALVGAGYRVTVVAPRGKAEPWRETLEGVELLRFPAVPDRPGAVGYALESAWSFLCVLARLVGLWRRAPFQVLQGCNPPDTYVLIGWLFQRLGVSYVFDQHDLAPDVYLARGGREGDVLHRTLAWFERRSYRGADHVVVTTSSYADVAAERGGLADDTVTVVRNGPDHRRFAAGPADPSTRGGAEHLVVYLGMMGAQDGVDTVIHAAARLVHDHGRDDIRFALLGDGQVRADLERLAAELDVTDQVVFTGLVDDDGIRRWLSSADLGLSPEPADPFNDRSAFIKVGEYLAFGLPVVAFDLTETRRTASEAAVYVAPGDVDGYAAAILDLLDDVPRRRELGTVGRGRVEDLLCWDRQVEAYVGVFDRLTGGAARPVATAPDTTVAA